MRLQPSIWERIKQAVIGAFVVVYFILFVPSRRSPKPSIKVERGKLHLVKFPGKCPWVGLPKKKYLIDKGVTRIGISLGLFGIRRSLSDSNEFLFRAEEAFEVESHLSTTLHGVTLGDKVRVRPVTPPDWGDAIPVACGTQDTTCRFPTSFHHLLRFDARPNGAVEFRGKKFGRPTDTPYPVRVKPDTGQPSLDEALPSPSERWIALVASFAHPEKDGGPVFTIPGLGSGPSHCTYLIDIYNVESGELVVSGRLDSGLVLSSARWAGDELFVMPAGSSLGQCVIAQLPSPV